MLTQEQKDLVKATIPALEAHGEQITSRFYELLFQQHPELKNIFNQTNQRQGRQQTALANAVYAAAVHIDNLEAIIPTVKQIGYKHRGLGVKPEHYPIVGQTLLAAIKDVLKDAATDEIIDAWAQAYGAIANAFIGVEKGMYDQAKNQPGGWEGFRKFSVIDKIKESDVITSFYLRPEDGQAIASYHPGQYITIRATIPGEQYTHMRQYSLSDAPHQEYYRISVKREDGFGDRPAGVVSTYLHNHVNIGDTVEISAPSGDFFMAEVPTRPVVFLSGGVGMTPLVAMLNSLIQKAPQHDITYIHAAQYGTVHAMREHFDNLADAHDNFNYRIVYEKPSEQDRNHRYFAKDGFVTLDWLQTVASPDAEFYFCGPTPFMRAVNQALRMWGIDDSRIHYEFFGPKSDLEVVQSVVKQVAEVRA